MARRKRQILSDDDSSDDSREEDGDDFNPGENNDERAERELFQNPYARNKKRKRRDLDNEDDEDEGFGGCQPAARKRSDWTKAPNFVSGGIKTVTLDEAEGIDSSDEVTGEPGPQHEDDVDHDEELDEEAEEIPPGDEEESDQDMDVSDEDQPVAEPRIREPEEDEEANPARSGFSAARSMMSSFSTTAGTSAAPSSTAGIGARGGIGAGRGGITSSAASYGLPAAFGASTPPVERSKPSFVRSAPVTAPGTPTPPNLTTAERRHFDSLSNTIGAKLMAKMGWQAGQGLGAEGKGIVNPIETKMRPTKSGIAYRGFKEKTEQSKAEARRRGEHVSDEEDQRPAMGGMQRGERAEVLRKTMKKGKVKVEHKTYEELIREAGADESAMLPDLGIIIDATGPEMREVSLSEASAFWAPTADQTPPPQVDETKLALQGLAREGRALNEREKYLAGEGKRLGSMVRQEAEMIARLERMRLLVDQLNEEAKEITATYEPSLDPFTKSFETILNEFSTESDKFGVEEVFVGAMSPVIRRMVTNWEPLLHPEAISQPFYQWRRAFLLRPFQPPNERFSNKGQSDENALQMTPYESLVWTVWLPKVRMSINNSWDPIDPDPAIHLYKTWAPLLPDFIQANILDQLLLPKLSKVVADWDWRKSVPLHSFVFPWLEYLDLRSEQLLEDCKRKIKSVLKTWNVNDGLWKQITAWRDVFAPGDWDNMLLKLIVPKLSAIMREDFKVNPRDQKMEPLNRVLEWKDVIRPSVMGQLLEKELFPKWLNVLHFWLVQPKTSFEDVAQWYSFWKGYLPTSVSKLEPVEQGFNRGLHLMNLAIELGPSVAKELPRPETLATKNASRTGVSTTRPQNGTPKHAAAPLAAEVTFRSIVEDFVAAHNLLFIPIGQVHEVSRMPLYRVSPSIDGKGGITAYLLDDAVWMQEGADWKAVSLEEMVLRANRAGARQR
ncbi:TFP11-domain-containing protein [Dacryopinax primogenitus]|uniref:TFP11-domain-containing protein n=1 Tax=Dacryopinax primogenitus (strain DJM 731) TaxID=1858805 RepID=M5GEZ5_DACPD|nr:TFP11-domain-containing protein [Dacryopinax primogenitus]EJU03688.1 TFP11-domain-containing protein [Dacryopinax primogenitus]